uniref:Nucleoside diphosphate kinase homolog 5 n=1 Tax=Timema cristinae TaxID=61476 RepID=A0A7R9DAK6_TIMCR|nr:unnamed protein product [Timema cristinae]
MGKTAPLVEQEQSVTAPPLDLFLLPAPLVEQEQSVTAPPLDLFLLTAPLVEQDAVCDRDEEQGYFGPVTTLSVTETRSKRRGARLLWTCYNAVCDRDEEQGYFGPITALSVTETRSKFQKRHVTLTPEQASEFYQEQEGTPLFPLLVTYMSSGRLVALCLMRQDAVSGWKALMGPANTIEARQYYPFSLRARFGDPNHQHKNALHGSDSAESAVREIHFFFPEMMVEPLLTGTALAEYLATSVNPTLMQGLAQLCKVKPVDPVVWLADWLLMNNPNKPLTDEITALTTT